MYQQNAPEENIAVLLSPSDHYMMGEALHETGAAPDVCRMCGIQQGKSLESVFTGVEKQVTF